MIWGTVLTDEMQTYGLELITKEAYEKSMHDWYKPDGCRDHLLLCQNLARKHDPDWQGKDPAVSRCFKEYQRTCPSIGDFYRKLRVSCL